MLGYEITFETKCYEKDWEILLKTDRLQRMIEFNQIAFKEKILYINNVNNAKTVCSYAKNLVKRGVVSEVVNVDDYAREVLDFFQIEKESFQGGYYYSISELVSIYLCRTPYLLHFSSDSILEKPFAWVTPSILRMEEDDAVKVANPVWNSNFAEARNESFHEDEDYFTGYGFSDQCYLIRAADLRAPIYNEQHPLSRRYPAYGGQLFEKRVDSWMRNHQYKRITYKHGSYIHRNFPDNRLRRKLMIALGWFSL